MVIPPIGSNRDVDGSGGESYGAVLVAGDADVEDALRGIRFSGWIAPPADGWTVVLGDPGGGVVATGGRGFVEVGETLASHAAVVFAVQVRNDRQLAVVAWRDGVEVGRYCSDPSRDPGADRDVLSEPFGAEAATGFAALAGVPDAAEALERLLDEELDTDSVFESERLASVLRLLGLPRWIVAAGALPRAVPTGPADLVRLRVGERGAAGLTRNTVVARSRRGKTPPPVIADPPRGFGGFEPWML